MQMFLIRNEDLQVIINLFNNDITTKIRWTVTFNVNMHMNFGHHNNNTWLITLIINSYNTSRVEENL